MRPARRLFSVAKQATVCVADGTTHKGQGLLLDLGDEGTFVLTCHHIVSPIDAANLRVVAPGPDGARNTLTASLVPGLSHREKDAVVLKVKPPDRRVDRPWLHELGREYAGTLEARCVLYLADDIQLDEFPAVIGGSSTNLRVPGTGEISQYVLPRAYVLTGDVDARPGISGAVVVSQAGVLGLVHFAKSETPGAARALYVNPLSAWADGWATLAALIQPFVDDRLAGHARILRARDQGLKTFLKITDYSAAYLRRAIDDAASTFVSEQQRLLLVGKTRSGKTRIVLELLKEDRDALVVIAKRRSPPDDFEESSFVGRKVILLLDNLGDDEIALEPISWWERFSGINESDTVFIATCRDGADWERLRADDPHLESRLRNATVHTSAPQGTDLTRGEAEQLVGLLGLDEDALSQFDGTPGSVLDGTIPVVPLLPAGAGREVELTRVEDATGHARGNLPALSSEFVGREAEIEAIMSLLHSERLITISGPAGAGKTRLALHVGDLVRADFADGVWIAELSSYHTHALVADVVAAALGVPDGLTQSAPDGLATFVGSKQLLLILNGCDYVSGTVVELAGPLLERCERLVILTTSREPLGAAGERVLELPPFGAPAGGEPSDAMSLFISRLPETPGQGPLTDSDRSTVARICRSLGGNALAIELVATAATAGLGLLALKLANGIGSGAGEKPGALSAAPLRDAVELVADNVLGEPERELFDRVSVFVGGFTLDAAQSIAGDAGLDRDEVPELLRHLVDQRLVVIDKLAPTTERYRMLESVRQEGRRRLAARDMLEPTERSHAAYVLVLAQEAETRRGQDGEAELLDRLDVEIANVRAALWWAVETRQPEIGAQLGARLWWFWYQRSHLTEGRHHLDRLIVLSRAQLRSSNPVLLAELLNGAGNFAYNQGDFDRSEELHSEAHDLRQAAGEHSLVAGSLNNIGLVARRRGQAERAEELFRKALAISRSYANHFWESMHLNNLGLVLEEWMEAHAEARDCQEESLNICARLGATWGTAQALSALGLLVANDGRLDEATQLLERSRRLRTEIDNPQGIAESLNGLGRIGLLARDPETAANRYREAFELFERVGDRAGMAESLEGLGMTKIPRDAAAGTRLLGAANALRTQIGFAQPPRARREVEAALAAAKENLGNQPFDAEWRYGHEELPHEAVTLEGPSERSRADPAESGAAARRGRPHSPSG